MCTSVPQMVVVVMRMTAWPARATGLGRSSSASRFFSLKTTAFMVCMARLLGFPERDVYWNAVADAGGHGAEVLEQRLAAFDPRREFREFRRELDVDAADAEAATLVAHDVRRHVSGEVGRFDP